MSDAATIARALGGVRNTNGNGYLCRCPLPTHGKRRGDRHPSLSVRDGDKPNRVLVTCFTGCCREDVIAELKRLNLIHSDHDDACGRNRDHRRDFPNQESSHDLKRVALDKPLYGNAKSDDVGPNPEALSIWHESAPASGTIIESKYLTAGRGIVIAAPPSLRYLRLPYPNAAVCRGAHLTEVEVVRKTLFQPFEPKLIAELRGHSFTLRPDQPASQPTIATLRAVRLFTAISRMATG
jgi:hypothetical protein